MLVCHVHSFELVLDPASCLGCLVPGRIGKRMVPIPQGLVDNPIDGIADVLGTCWIQAGDVDLEDLPEKPRGSVEGTEERAAPTSFVHCLPKVVEGLRRQLGNVQWNRVLPTCAQPCCLLCT